MKVSCYLSVFIFIFCLEPTVRNKAWMGTTSISAVLKFYLITAMFKVLSQQLRGTLTLTLKRHFTVEDFIEMDQLQCKSILDQHTCKTYIQQNSALVKHHETKIDEGVSKIKSSTKIQACTSKNIPPR